MAEVAVLAEEPDTRRVYRRFAPHLRPHRRIIAASLVVTLLSTVAVVAIAPMIGRGVDAVIAGDRVALWVAVGVLTLLVVARMVLLRASTVLLVRAGERVMRELRDRAVAQLAAASLRFVEAHRTGDLLRRTTAELADLALFGQRHLPNLLGILITIGMTTVVLLVYSWLLTLIMLGLFVPAALAVIGWFHRDASAAFSRKAAAESTVTATFNETLAARETLELAGGLGAWRRRFRGDTADLLRAATRTVAVQNRLEGVALLEGLATAALLVLGVWLVSADRISVGTVVVFVLATRNLFEGLVDLSELIGDLQTAKVGLARLLDLLHRTRPADRPGPSRSLPPRGELVASDLRYAYLDGHDVLHDIGVRFPPGDRAGLVGETGSGKTTLAKLLTGLYRPDQGSVRFAGVDLCDVDEDELRSCIVLIPQQVHLITGTVADNLALAPSDPDRSAMERAVVRLGLDDWVAGLPDGLDTPVGARGERLSAGERQLIGLLRASLVDPAVLVLDEATADLDPVTAHRLETAIDRLRADRTLIVIAHRESTIDRLPRTVRLTHGYLSG